MEDFITNTELVKLTGKNPVTIRRIVTKLGIVPVKDIYDDRLKLYSPEQVEQVLQVTNRINYTKKEVSNEGV